MIQRPGWRERMRYQFDKSMSKGPIALIGWLALISVGVILLAAILLTVTGIVPDGSTPMSFVDDVWASLMRTMDAGTLGGDNGWGFRLVMLVVTFAGICIFSALVGVLNTRLEVIGDRPTIDMQQVGASRHAQLAALDPLSHDHIAVLGYNDHLVPQVPTPARW